MWKFDEFFLSLFLSSTFSRRRKESVESRIGEIGCSNFYFVFQLHFFFFFFHFDRFVSNCIILLCYDSYIDSPHSFLFSFAFVFFFFADLPSIFP